MSEQGSSNHAEADTQEWELPHKPEGHYERIEYELVGRQGVPLRRDFKHPVEIRLGRDERTSACYLVKGDRCPQLGAELIVVQPAVVHQDPTRGWAGIGGRFEDTVDLGREVSPQLRLGPDVSREHCFIDMGHELINIGNLGRNGTRVVVAPDDLGLDIGLFNRSLDDPF